jgi:hypothetical protein
MGGMAVRDGGDVDIEVQPSIARVVAESKSERRRNEIVMCVS